MNAHLNWHADEVLEFELKLFNPLSVSIPLTKLELFANDKESPLAATI